jgi:hypothetical protein
MNSNPKVPKIVYHGTLSDEPPHTYGEPFHAGTLRAASERLDDEISHGVDWDEVGTATAKIHKYEISDTAPISRKMWDDPMFYSEEGGLPVPEHKQNRIYPYVNSREDVNNPSYVIPSQFVGNHVKHLGVQFESVVGSKRGPTDASL